MTILSYKDRHTSYKRNSNIIVYPWFLERCFVLVSSLHSNAGVFVNDGEPGLLQDVDEWLNRIAPHRDDYHHGPRGESNAGAHLQNLLLHHQVLVSLNDGKLELGPWQQVVYAELDGQRPKRILIKVCGE